MSPVRTIILPSHTRAFNFALVLLFGAMLIGYILILNYNLSQGYRFQVLKRRLDQANASLQNITQDDNQNMKALMNFAQKSGMVEAKDSYSLFPNSGVAVSAATLSTANQ